MRDVLRHDSLGPKKRKGKKKEGGGEGKRERKAESSVHVPCQTSLY